MRSGFYSNLRMPGFTFPLVCFQAVLPLFLRIFARLRKAHFLPRKTLKNKD